MFSEAQIARYNRHISDGWIGVDLDGTLAEYHSWDAALKFGAPIPRMVERIKAWLEMGLEVRIVTARIPLSYDSVQYCEIDQRNWDRSDMEHAIGLYTKQHVGEYLTAQCHKDLHMLELWDDRAVQVVANTGMTLAEQLTSEPVAEAMAETSALSGKP